MKNLNTNKIVEYMRGGKEHIIEIAMLAVVFKDRFTDEQRAIISNILDRTEIVRFALIKGAARAAFGYRSDNAKRITFEECGHYVLRIGEFEVTYNLFHDETYELKPNCLSIRHITTPIIAFTPRTATTNTSYTRHEDIDNAIQNFTSLRAKYWLDNQNECDKAMFDVVATALRVAHEDAIRLEEQFSNDTIESLVAEAA